MCGRYSLGVPHQEMVRHMVEYPDLEVSDADWIDQERFMPRYNIAPRSNAPVIRRREDNTLVIHTMVELKWGVVPHWSKHEDLTLNTINARAENLLESGGMWASMKTKKRCVVVCDGYYEWLKKGKERLPHFIRRKDSRLMILAGLYDSVVLEGASTPLWTFTVVTSDAAPSFMWLHDRQPVILSTTKDFEAWLDISKGWHAGAAELLKPQDGSDLECYPVPKEVGKVSANSPSFIQPISQRKDGIQAMFAKQTARGKSDSGLPAPKTPQEEPTTVFGTHVKSAKLPSSNGSKSSKRATEPDVSPSSSPSTSQRSPKKQKLSHLHDGQAKRPIDDNDGGTLVRKRLKLPESGTESPDASGGSDKLRATGDIKSKDKTPSSSPKKKLTSKNADAGSAKITSFFRPQS